MTLQSLADTFSPGWVGTLIGLIGIVIGVGVSAYFYYKGKTVRQLSYAAADTFSVGVPMVEDHTVAGLKIVYHDAALSRVAGSKFALWNSGTETVGGEQIAELDPLTIGFDDVQVLSVEVATQSRPVVNARVQLADGKVRVDFDFLDPGDCLVLSLVHTGGTASALAVNGTVRGLLHGIIRARMLRRVSFRQAANRTALLITFVAFIGSLTSHSQVVSPFIFPSDPLQVELVYGFNIVLIFIVLSFLLPWVADALFKLRLRRIPPLVRRDAFLFRVVAG